MCGWISLLIWEIVGCRYDGCGTDTQHQVGSCVLGLLLLPLQPLRWLYYYAA